MSGQRIAQSDQRTMRGHAGRGGRDRRHRSTDQGNEGDGQCRNVSYSHRSHFRGVTTPPARSANRIVTRRRAARSGADGVPNIQPMATIALRVRRSSDPPNRRCELSHRLPEPDRITDPGSGIGFVGLAWELTGQLTMPPAEARGIVWSNPGGVLLSQGATPQVPSALAGLTAVFGMGTGVSPPPWPPETVRSPGLEDHGRSDRCPSPA